MTEKGAHRPKKREKNLTLFEYSTKNNEQMKLRQRASVLFFFAGGAKHMSAAHIPFWGTNSSMDFSLRHTNGMHFPTIRLAKRNGSSLYVMSYTFASKFH